MEHPAIGILNRNRIMSISTLRPDGWPQTTVVGYSNAGFDLFFLIFRASQKFANIQRDDRISIAVAAEPPELGKLQAVYAGAHAAEIKGARERQAAWKMLMERHSNLAGFKIPDAQDAVFMRARCKFVSLLDYTQGPGHREQFVIDDSGAPANVGLAEDHWGGLAGQDREAGKSTN